MRTLCALLCACAALAQAQPVLVGSKKFTESYVLGEIAKGALEKAGSSVEHRQGMGGTIVVWQALASGGIHAYPEYTGTIAEEILKQPGIDARAMRQGLAKFGVGMTSELGFNNTYALVMTRARAAELGVRTISDLAKHPELKAGPTHEFLGRKDGWQPMAARYGLRMASSRGIDHALGYQALQSGQIDVKDAYSTDAKIADLDLALLEDDLGYFPQYKAVFLYRLDMSPRAVVALEALAGTLDEARMTALNARAEATKDYAAAGAEYFDAEQAAAPSRLGGWIARHLTLVGLSMLFAVLVAVPLGIFAARPGALSATILGVVGVIQTVPSLALLALLVPVPFFGISWRTAVFALFLYSLLPIVRNTATALRDIPQPLRESAAALGLPPWARLTSVYLPMASSGILAGVKTSAVINVGTATLAALIGAGGLGEPIISGLNLIDANLILQGAVPAALLAVAVQFAFDGFERVAIPKGMRLLRR